MTLTYKQKSNIYGDVVVSAGCPQAPLRSLVMMFPWRQNSLCWKLTSRVFVATCTSTPYLQRQVYSSPGGGKQLVTVSWIQGSLTIMLVFSRIKWCLFCLYSVNEPASLNVVHLFTTWFVEYFIPNCETAVGGKRLITNITLLLIDNWVCHPRALVEMSSKRCSFPACCPIKHSGAHGSSSSYDFQMLLKRGIL